MRFPPAKHLLSCHHTCVSVWHKRGGPVSQRAFLPFFHRHSDRRGCCMRLAGHAPASDSPGFARSDPRQARAGATLSARTRRGAQEREPSPNPPEKCTCAPDLVDATGLASSRRASSHWVGARRAHRRPETFAVVYHTVAHLFLQKLSFVLTPSKTNVNYTCIRRRPTQ